MGRLPRRGGAAERGAARWQPLRRLHRQAAHTSPGLASGRSGRKSAPPSVYWNGCQHRAAASPLTRRTTSILTSHASAVDTRWRLVHRLVNELDVAVRDRTAGLLLLLFAQSLSRICALSRGDVLDDGTTLRLRLGTHPVEVPPPLDGMLRELVRHPVGKAHRLEPCPSRRLFRRSRAGRPMRPVSLSRRLKALGIRPRPRPTRNASLMDLAAELPVFASAVCSASASRRQRTGWPRAATRPAMPLTGPAGRAASDAYPGSDR